MSSKDAKHKSRQLACFFCRVQYWNTVMSKLVCFMCWVKKNTSKAVKHSQVDWQMLNELILAQFVREVLLNIKVSRAKLFRSRTKKPWHWEVLGILFKKCLKRSETPFDDAGRAFIRFEKLQMLLKKGNKKEHKRKGEKIEKNRVAVCGSSATRILSFSVFWLFLNWQALSHKDERLSNVGLKRWLSRKTCSYLQQRFKQLSEQLNEFLVGKKPDRRHFSR